MSQTTKFDQLPKELIAHIASCCDATSALSLSRTSRSIRLATYDGLVFKQILTSSQASNWNSDSLDLDAMSTRAGNDAAIWARYAVADQTAWSLQIQWQPLMDQPQKFVSYLPELHLVKHPHLQDSTWKSQLHFMRLDQVPSIRFCIAMTLLGPDSSKTFPEMTQAIIKEPHLFQRNTTDAILHSLNSIIVTLRMNLRSRLHAWPYNSDANVPYIRLPTTAQIPLRPLNDSYQLPIPFSRRAIELLGNSKTSFSNWDSWYDLHNLASFRSDGYLTSGTWCGYYSSALGDLQMVDPPMTNIRFVITTPRDRDAATGDETVELRGDDGEDGHGRFNILRATMSYTNRRVGFRARKQYHLHHGWDWECQLTPFGIVGFWGTGFSTRETPHRHGIVWLWKQEWTEEGGRKEA